MRSWPAPLDLADPAERLQMAGEIRPAHRDADPVTALGQRPHHVAAEEARTAEYGDQLVVLGLEGHEFKARGAIAAPAEYSKGFGPSRGRRGFD